MGLSRGGLTSKIHALVDAEGRPVALKITEGQAHDGRSAADMLGGLGAGQILLGDRAYDSDALRAQMAEQGGVGKREADAQPQASAGVQPVPVQVP
jgi:transposase